MGWGEIDWKCPLTYEMMIEVWSWDGRFGSFSSTPFSSIIPNLPSHEPKPALHCIFIMRLMGTNKLRWKKINTYQNTDSFFGENHRL